MIIKFPTGLYKSVLPEGSSSGNITYIISSQNPPRSAVNANKLPVSEELLPAPESVHTDLERREQLGELVFSISSGSRSVPGSNVKFYEAGEVLIFDNLEPVEEVVATRAPDRIEVRHDTNLLDLEAVGLTTEEANAIRLLSAEKERDLQRQFSTKRTEISNLDASILENQKNINESTKTLNAIMELLGIPDGGTSDNSIYVKVANNLEDLKDQRNVLISSRNTASSELEEINQSIVRISELVR